MAADSAAGWRTERLWLRPFRAEDLPGLAAIEAHPEVRRHMTYAREGPADYAAFLASCRGWESEAPRSTWELAIDDGRLVGRCGLGLRDRGRQGLVWYLLDPAVHGRGYATEAARALLGLAFDTLGVHRVAADVDPRNAASARVCARLGMRREAWFVEDTEVRGEWCDTWIFALLRREWAERGGRNPSGG